MRGKTSIFGRFAGGTGFTLVEVLVVITIIGLLVSILLPSLNKAKLLAQATKTNARQTAIASACQAFRLDHNGFYPGQDATNSYSGSQNMLSSGQYAATEIAAWAILSDKQWTFPVNAYMPYTDGLLLSARGVAKNNNNDARAFADTFASPMPILYFPSIKGAMASDGSAPAVADMFNFAVNKDGTDYYTKGYTDTDFYKAACEPALGRKDRALNNGDWPNKADGAFAADQYLPYTSDGFMLVSPGPDRKWGTSDDIITKN